MHRHKRQMATTFQPRGRIREYAIRHIVKKISPENEMPFCFSPFDVQLTGEDGISMRNPVNSALFLKSRVCAKLEFVTVSLASGLAFSCTVS